VTVCAFFGFSQLGGLGSQVEQITITLTFLLGVGAPKNVCLRALQTYSYATGNGNPAGIRLVRSKRAEPDSSVSCLRSVV